MPGDRVDVELTPYDLTKGRIVYRILANFYENVKGFCGQNLSFENSMNKESVGISVTLLPPVASTGDEGEWVESFIAGNKY